MPKTNVSLSKLDETLFYNYSEIDGNERTKFIDDLIKYIDSELESVNAKTLLRNFYSSIEKTHYLFLYETKNSVAWERFIKSIDNEKNISDNILENKSISYLLIIEENNTYYSLTSGNANNLIDKFKDKNFGLRVLTKLYFESDPVIKDKIDSFVGGNRLSMQFLNRNVTTFEHEKEINSISRKVKAEVDELVQIEMGIIDEQDTKNKKIVVDFGNNIEINKKMTYEDIVRMIKKIDALEKNNDNIKFAIDNISLIEKYNISSSEVNKEFHGNIKSYIDHIHITYNKIFERQDLKIVYRNSNNQLNNVDEKIDSQEKVKEIIKSLVLANGVSSQTIFGYELLSEDNDERIAIKDLIEVELDFMNRQIYLIENKWYTFDDNYEKFYKEKFKKIIVDSKNFEENIFSYNLLGLKIKEAQNESSFNKEIEKKTSESLIYADRKLYQGIEIADAIYMDEINNKLILIHNKSKFTGAGVRDIIGQIRASSESILDFLNNKSDNFSKMKEYINSLKSYNNNQISAIETFEKMINDSNTNIIYIAAFVDEVKETTRSSYITFLLDDMRSFLHKNNQKFYIF